MLLNYNNWLISNLDINVNESNGNQRNQKPGVEIEIMIIIINTWNKHRISILNDAGIIISTASISFENLFKILPVGVDSKNCIVDRRIENNIELCKNLADLITIFKNAMSPNKFSTSCFV